MIAKACFFLAVGVLASGPAWSAETVTYTYDALGRLTQSAHSGSVNNGVQQSYTNDAADNRANVTVTGSPYNSSARVIVVPLGGLTVLAIHG